MGGQGDTHRIRGLTKSIDSDKRYSGWGGWGPRGLARRDHRTWLRRVGEAKRLLTYIPITYIILLIGSCKIQKDRAVDAPGTRTMSTNTKLAANLMSASSSIEVPQRQ